MDISRALKEGLSLANRNLPIILVKLVVAFIGILGFIFFVILPVSFALFLAGVSPFILTNLQAHEGLITSLPWVMLFSVFALVVFLLFSIAMNLFVYAATVGLMIKTKRDPAFKFRLGDFFSNGKRGFWPIFNYLALTGTSTVVLIIMAAGTVFLIRNLLDYLK
ncbi:MAG: hypothetical protein GXO99_08735, partial [Nitrospirae bacterium]|nr:hypothetical protein [Nitrospirota bacterium]